VPAEDEIMTDCSGFSPCASGAGTFSLLDK
jgi:hypothetical protein